jgi:hypothetical protein
MTDPSHITAGLHRQPNIAQKGSFHASRQYSACVLPRYRPSGSPTSLQLFLYYADRPLRRARLLLQHVFAALSSHSLIINFTWDVRKRQPPSFHHLLARANRKRVQLSVTTGSSRLACSL